MEIKEKWKDIQGYENLYQISNMGRIKSLWFGKEKIMKQLIRNGYCYVDLCKDKIKKHYNIHRLVAQTFIPNPQNYPQVNHKDEVKTNNCISNLEWVTQKYNMNYGTRNERASKAISIAHKGKKRTQEHKNNIGKSHQKPIVQIDKSGLIVGVYDSVKEVSEVLGINRGNISNCLKGRYKTCGDYKWMYLNELKKAS